jgi:hypothetical protein
MFTDANRLLRQDWGNDAQGLALELYAMFGGKTPLQNNAPMTVDNRGSGNGNAPMNLGTSSQGDRTAIAVNGGNGGKLQIYDTGGALYTDPTGKISSVPKIGIHIGQVQDGDGPSYSVGIYDNAGIPPGNMTPTPSPGGVAPAKLSVVVGSGEPQKPNKTVQALQLPLPPPSSPSEPPVDSTIPQGTWCIVVRVDEVQSTGNPVAGKGPFITIVEHYFIMAPVWL